MKKALYSIFGIATAIIGMEIHGSFGYAILNFFFWPISWIVWLLNHAVTVSVIKSAFSWFLK